MNLHIDGLVAPGYEPVRDLFEHNMRTFSERNSQLCIYVGDQCVVDLWASQTASSAFNGDTLINVFSSGKSLESILIAMLYDRGLLHYEDKIVDHWPEFGANHKTQTTIADLMRHEAGLAAFSESLEPQALLPENIRLNSIGAIIEKQPQHYRAGSGNTREYHAATRGWIANELFRRIEPSGRTMGQFLREEISDPQKIDVFIGLLEPELSRVCHVRPLGFRFQFLQSLIPKTLGRKIESNIFQLAKSLLQIVWAMRDRTQKSAPAPIKCTNLFSLFDSPVLCMGETPSAGAKCSARGLAKLAAAMANDGSIENLQVLSKEAIRALHHNPLKRDTSIMQTTFTQGGVACFETPGGDDWARDHQLNVGREGFCGWFGLGGSIFQWHRELNIGFAYVPTSLNVFDFVNERGKAYQSTVVKCLQERVRCEIEPTPRSSE